MYKCDGKDGIECADDGYFGPSNPYLRLIIPESSINYEEGMEDALEWTLNDSSYFIRLSPEQRYKQNLFVSQSGIYFESKWSFHEIDRKEKKFYELQEGSYWSEKESSSKYSSIFFRSS